MEQQLPIALQTALYAGSTAVVILAAGAMALLLRMRGRIERTVQAVEELKAELTPLARETRVVVRNLRELTGSVQRRWSELEGIIDTARGWSLLADRWVERVGCLVEPPVLAANHRLRVLRKGLEAFVRAWSNPTQASNGKRGSDE
jgi:hypothetical protein